MKNLKWSDEGFGYLVAFPSGEVGFYERSARDLIERNATVAECQPYRLARTKIPRDFHLRTPLIVWLELTRRCNLTCPHCFVDAGSPYASEANTDEIFALLDELKAMNVFSVVLTGGEPLLHRDFLRILHYAHDLGFIISVATNGTLITQELIDQLPREDLIVSVSLDGFTSHQTIRGKTDFDTIAQKLLLLKRNGIFTTVMTTLLKTNIDEVNALREWCASQDIILRSLPFSPIGRGQQHPELELDLNDTEKASRLWIEETKYELEANKNIPLCVGKLFDFCLSLVYATKRCKGGRSLAYIQADGEVFPCSLCAGTKLLSAGNVRQTKFSTLWADSFKEIRDFNWSDWDSCKRCELSNETYFCTNRCPPLGMIRRGSYLACGATPFERALIKRRTCLLADEVGHL